MMAACEVRYVPDVTGMMAECEANYARLLKLLPETGNRKLSVTYSHDHTVTVLFEVLEQFRYTSSVRISLCATSCDWLHLPSMAVRLYHDASMAEVVDAEHMRQLRGIYPYPNERMHHADEKMQRNLYLGEWLGYCLKNGQVVEEINFADV
jgi:uncharacterized protein YqiB (DUF1249 family)